MKNSLYESAIFIKTSSFLGIKASSKLQSIVIHVCLRHICMIFTQQEVCVGTVSYQLSQVIGFLIWTAPSHSALYMGVVKPFHTVHFCSSNKYILHCSTVHLNKGWTALFFSMHYSSPRNKSIALTLTQYILQYSTIYEMLRLLRRAFLFKIRFTCSMSADNAFLYIVQRKVPSRCKKTRDIYLADAPNTYCTVQCCMPNTTKPHRTPT